MEVATNTFLPWHADFVLGLQEIDEQHRNLFQSINRLWHAVATRANPEQMLSAINDLEQRTMAHFAVEESLMRVTAYPDFEAHKREHTKIVKRLAVEKANLLLGKRVRLEMLHFLKMSTIDHIQGMDRAFVEAHVGAKHRSSILGKLLHAFH